jgi:hypothetical protein
VQRALGLLALISVLGLAPAAAGRTYVWIDDAGITHVTDDSASVPPGARPRLVPEGAARSHLWDDGLTGPPPPALHDGTHSEADRARRLVHGALEDLGRGETLRAASDLEAALRIAPHTAEAHWYLALLEQQRGHLGEAESHLRDFLTSAGESLAPWRASAARRLAALADEERLARPLSPSAPLVLVAREHPLFRLELDPALAGGDRDYLATVLRYLEEARAHGSKQLGVEPGEPTGVVLYGKAAYLQAHRHRFTFQTVGFFDGRIHVVSAAHPAGELRALLFHEFTHALFRERTRGDYPYWLNEGLAELAGRDARSQDGLSRSERESLRTSIDDGRWLPLGQLSAGFAGLTDVAARAAYLQSTAAAAWIVARTDAAARADLLRRLGAGDTEDDALRAVLGRDTKGVDAAVRAEIRREFPAFAP